MNCRILHAACYSNPQTFVQFHSCFMLVLYLRGMDYMNVFDHGHNPVPAPFPMDGTVPFLALIPPGSITEFRMNGRRENWVIQGHFPELIPDTAGIGCTFHQTRLSSFLAISPDRTEEWKARFAAVAENSTSGLPSGQERAKLITGGILAELIQDQGQGPVKNPIAAALKRAIDEDRVFQKSLKELNGQAGPYSTAYMRHLFFQEYGILPGEYRARQRMNRILELISRTDLSLKEIADQVGMKHITHLYAFLKTHQQLSPKELLLQFRER